MSRLLARVGLSLAFFTMSLTSALAFGPAGPWDATVLDNPVRPPASIGAAIAGASALGNSRAAANDQASKPKVSGLQTSCSLNIASPTVPQGTSGSTIVLEANVRAPIIQVCR